MSQNVPETGRPPEQTPDHPIVDFTFADLRALLRRAVRVTAALGIAGSLFLWLAMGWPTAALFAVGAALSQQEAVALLLSPSSEIAPRPKPAARDAV